MKDATGKNIKINDWVAIAFPEPRTYGFGDPNSPICSIKFGKIIQISEESVKIFMAYGEGGTYRAFDLRNDTVSTYLIVVDSIPETVATGLTECMKEVAQGRFCHERLASEA